jgi:DNA-binding NarL/FixJ family response regulator
VPVFPPFHCERHTLRLIRDGLLLGPPGRRHPPTQIHESFLGNVDAEGAGDVFLGRHEHPLLAQATESATAALGPTRFDAEVRAGARYSRDAPIGLALGEPDFAAVEASQNEASGLPGKREEEVARLVAEGLSNKRIGARLFISERTVESHVRGILNKPGFNSRAQIAGRMASPNQ